MKTGKLGVTECGDEFAHDSPHRQFLQQAKHLVSGHIQKRLRIFLRDQEQCARRARRRPAPLLPLLQRSRGNAQETREIRLRQSRLLAHAGHRRNRRHAAGPTNDGSRFGALVEIALQPRQFIVGQILISLASEKLRRDEDEHFD